MKTSGIDSAWRPRPAGADARLRAWLLDRGSLTRRIQLRCKRFDVAIIAQGLAMPCRDERRLLRLGPAECCIVREVRLNCGRKPVVYAHSVLSRRATRGAWRMVMSLGRQPLGAALFADPRVKRYPLRFRQINRGNALFRRASGLLDEPPAQFWARRSLFVLRGARLLVTEVFLPAILTFAS